MKSKRRLKMKKNQLMKNMMLKIGKEKIESAYDYEDYEEKKHLNKRQSKCFKNSQ